MASVKKRGDSYLISVSMGYDRTGRQIVRTKTFKPKPNMTEKQIAKELERQKVTFEEQMKQGFAAPGHQTFEEYAEYVLELKERAGLKHQSLERYKRLLERINPAIGFMKLSDIRPVHINEFYKKLSKQGGRANGKKYRCKVDFTAVMRQAGYTYEALTKAASVSIGVLTSCKQHKSVLEKTAVKLADTLSMPLDKLFEPVPDNSPLSAKTVLLYHQLIHAILQQAEKEMIVPYNAADKVQLPKQERKRANYFTVEDIQSIIQALENEPLQWRVMVMAFIYTGCRRGEILGLKWDKIDFEKNEVRIDNNLLYSKERGVYEDTPKTPESIRTISIPEPMVDLFSQWRDEQRLEMFQCGDRWTYTGFVFTRDNGQPMNPEAVTCWLGRFSERHDLPHINPHAFRHTMATILIASGVDVVTASHRLGHSNVSTTTNIYSHALQEADRKASDCIEQVIEKKNTGAG